MPAELVLPEVITLLEARPALSWIHVERFRGVLGFPDLLIAGPGGILYREVKPDRFSHLRSGQTRWRYALVAVCVNYAVWSQEGLDDGSIEAELEQVTHPAQISLVDRLTGFPGRPCDLEQEIHVSAGDGRCQCGAWEL